MITRRAFMYGALSTCALSYVRADALLKTTAQPKILSFYNTHTGETLKNITVFENAWLPDALLQIQHLFRDHRTDESHAIDTHLLALLHDLQKTLGVPSHEPFHLISGYRSQKTNRMLCSKSSGVAKKSQHLLGKAADIALPKTRSIQEIKRAAIQLKRGGVGAYKDFVHVDTGSVRRW